MCSRGDQLTPRLRDRDRLTSLVVEGDLDAPRFGDDAVADAKRVLEIEARRPEARGAHLDVDGLAVPDRRAEVDLHPGDDHLQLVEALDHAGFEEVGGQGMLVVRTEVGW